MLVRGLLVAVAMLPSLFAQPLEVRAWDLLNAKCTGCHGEARMSGLDLRTRESFLRGGKRGPAAAHLGKAIRGEGELRMPPGKTPLPAADVALLTEWLNSGAEYPIAQKNAAPAWWSFQKIERRGEARSIDAFLNAKLAEKDLRPLPAADKRTLIRRATFDLHGLPPTPEEIDSFVNDASPQAYAKVIDRLLASPRYGERWGRRWLDVARYAETGGYETDVSFSNAWRYRDYVIRSFNNDKPYNDFMREQIAADEIWPGDLEREGGYFIPQEKLDRLERWIGTGLFAVGPVNYEFALSGDQFRVEWQADAVETTGSAFLGLTLGCARCHDHKFDPIPQRDYYRFAALFAGSEDREIPIVGRYGIFDYARHVPRQEKADQIKARIQRMDKARGGRAMTAAERDERETDLRKLGEAYLKAPPRVQTATILAHTEVVPETFILGRGEFTNKGERVAPGVLSAIGGGPEIREPAQGPFVPQRRKALAEWIASPENPLPARVMVNRIWQGHFGRGIVNTPNDFGRQGDPPSHPDLLDWLAAEFIEKGWSVKHMHRLMMNSEAYRRSSAPDAANARIDAANTYLWRMNRRRLEGEEIRDAVIQTAGQLNTKMGGPPVVLPLSKEEFLGIREPELWPITLDPAEHTRRSVYLYVKRSFKMPMLETFDVPDPTQSCARRESSTVAPQALAMMNGDFTRTYAEKMAARFQGSNAVEQAWRHALGRAPAAEEAERAGTFLRRNTLSDLMLLLLNMNEFLYVD
ncbi:MAG: PSD1 domain-containing protein [Bryobacterales bacterium]|nr:PSD1 domain-containing protein [Bryobacterales bacterium]